MKAGGSGVQGHPGLRAETEASLDYETPVVFKRHTPWVGWGGVGVNMRCCRVLQARVINSAKYIDKEWY